MIRKKLMLVKSASKYVRLPNQRQSNNEREICNTTLIMLNMLKYVNSRNYNFGQ